MRVGISKNLLASSLVHFRRKRSQYQLPQPSATTVMTVVAAPLSFLYVCIFNHGLTLGGMDISQALVAGSPGLGLTSPFHFFTTGYGSSVVAIAAVNIIKSGGISSLGDKSLLGERIIRECTARCRICRV